MKSPCAHGRGETLGAIADINLECLICWSEEGVLPLDLDPDACMRAAKCPYPLVNLAQVMRAPSGRVHGPANARAFAAALNAMMLAWHIARSQPADCQLLLGLCLSDTTALAKSSPGQIVQMAEHGAYQLLPRWSNSRGFWNSLVRCAVTADELGLEAAKLLGLQLLISERLGQRQCA